MSKAVNRFLKVAGLAWQPDPTRYWVRLAVTPTDVGSGWAGGANTIGSGWAARYFQFYLLPFLDFFFLLLFNFFFIL